MSTAEDLEVAVKRLPPHELSKFQTWFEEFVAARFDQRITQDAKAGKLDALAEAARAEFDAGRAQPL